MYADECTEGVQGFGWREEKKKKNALNNAGDVQVVDILDRFPKAHTGTSRTPSAFLCAGVDFQWLLLKLFPTSYNTVLSA